MDAYCGFVPVKTSSMPVSSSPPSLLSFRIFADRARFRKQNTLPLLSEAFPVHPAEIWPLTSGIDDMPLKASTKSSRNSFAVQNAVFNTVKTTRSTYFNMLKVPLPYIFPPSDCLTTAKSYSTPPQQDTLLYAENICILWSFVRVSSYHQPWLIIRQ